jgi:hypothetical protein
VRLDVANNARHAFSSFLAAQLQKIVDGFLDVSLLAVPVDNPRVGIASGVHRQKICVAGHKDTALGQSQRQNRPKVIHSKQVGIGKRQHVIAAKSQGDSNRMVDVLVEEETDIPVVPSLGLTPLGRTVGFLHLAGEGIVVLDLAVNLVAMVKVVGQSGMHVRQ